MVLRVLLGALAAAIHLLATPTLAAQSLSELTDEELRERILEETSLPLSKRKAALAQLRRRKSVAARNLMLELFESETHIDTRYDLLNAATKLQDNQVVRELLRKWIRDPESPWKILRGCGWGYLRQGRAGKDMFVEDFAAADARVQGAVCEIFGRMKSHAGATEALRAAVLRAVADVPARGEVADDQVKFVYELVRAVRGHRVDRDWEEWLVETCGSRLLPVAAEATRQLADVDLARALPSARRLAREAEMFEWDRKRPRAALALVLSRDTASRALPAFLDAAAGVKKRLVEEFESEDEDRLDELWGLITKHVLSKSDRDAAAILRRRTAVNLMSAFRTEAATEGLLRAVSDVDPAVTVAAIQELLARLSPQIQKKLERGLRRAKGVTRAELLRAVARWKGGSRKWQDRLAPELAPRKHLSVRIAALDLLAVAGRLDRLEDAHQFLEAGEWPLRSAAVEFCRKVRHKSSIPLLIGRLGVESGRLADEVQAALEDLSGRRFARAEFWQKWWDAAGPAFVVEDQAVAKERIAATDGLSYHGIAVISDRVCFVVDTSGSMSSKASTDGGKTRLQLAKDALIRVADGLEPHRKLNVVDFSTRARSWSKSLRAAEPDAVDDLKQYVRDLKALGSTNVFAAMEKAFADSEVDTIYLLSDGEPSSGEIVDTADLADAIMGWNRSRRVVVHTIAIGLKSGMMKRVAEQSGGRYVELR